MLTRARDGKLNAARAFLLPWCREIYRSLREYVGGTLERLRGEIEFQLDLPRVQRTDIRGGLNNNRV